MHYNRPLLRYQLASGGTMADIDLKQIKLNLRIFQILFRILHTKDISDSIFVIRTQAAAEKKPLVGNQEQYFDTILHRDQYLNSSFFCLIYCKRAT